MRGFLKLALATMMALLGVAGAPVASAEDSDLTKLTKDLKQKDGLFKLWHSEQKMLMRIPTTSFGKNYIVITSIARGISSGSVLGGMSWNFGDDMVWTFKKVGDKIHVLRRNVRFKAKKGTPEANAVKIAYSDSVLYALPILDESDGYLVDVTRIFMSDDVRIGPAIGSGYRFASDRSTWAKVNAYPENIELQVAAVYAGNGSIETVSDSRGVQVNVHYSISELKSNGYKPRLADDRVGYFLSVQKDFSDEKDDQNFVRFINRWHLEKADPKAKLSPPKEPIIFYIENTVPVRLRPYVQAGIEEWNKAFEEIGFSNAIQVRQQRDDATWDPEDVRYNTFRWITADAGFAMGPSRVNPFTGEILDADIIFDASFLRYWREDYENLTDEETARAIIGAPAPVERDQEKSSYANMFGRPASHHHGPGAECQLCRGMSHQMSYSAAALMAAGKTGDADDNGRLPDEFIHQALKEVVMHEVGHTLGLRHNFKASAWKTMEQMNTADPSVPTIASVMDYAPANIVKPGEEQGLYYTQTVGPYDKWAIEYGYKPFESSKAEAEGLKKIASQGAEDGLDYLTDEDTRGSDSDPLSNRFDLGKDPLVFVERQMTIVNTLLPKVVERSLREGEGYQRARQAFGVLMGEYWRAARFASRFPGGLHVHRDHYGDPNSRQPFKVVDPKEQRQAMDLLMNSAFASPSFEPEVLNSLAATRWNHWGMSSYSRLDYPIHETVARMQGIILSNLFSTLTLERLVDNEKKVAIDADAYTLAEHLRRLKEGLFAEWTPGDSLKGKTFTERKPYIDSYRRSLQRQGLNKFADLVLKSYAPEDARTLGRMHLRDLDGSLSALLESKDVKLDAYTRAHLMDAKARIGQILDAELAVDSVR